MASDQINNWMTYKNYPDAETYPKDSNTGSGMRLIECEPNWRKNNRTQTVTITNVVMGSATETKQVQVLQYGSAQYFDDDCAKKILASGGSVVFEGECNFENIFVSLGGESADAAKIPGRNDGYHNWADEGYSEPGDAWATSDITRCTVTVKARGWVAKDSEWVEGTVTRTYPGDWGNPGSWPIVPSTLIDEDATNVTVTVTIILETGVLPISKTIGGQSFPNCVYVILRNHGTGVTPENQMDVYLSAKVASQL